VVIRTPHGGGIHAPEHHSESTETLLCHIPGIRVVCPSSPARAYGLLLAAIRDPDPVMFLEPVRLYRAMRQEVPMMDRRCRSTMLHSARGLRRHHRDLGCHDHRNLRAVAELEKRRESVPRSSISRP
jgi:pyruvate/2-oxoglutarate/acetoin dehydrogenase E1 component